MIKLHKIDKTTADTRIDVLTFDFSDSAVSGDSAVELVKAINILDGEGYTLSNEYDRGGVHIIEYTLWDEYPVRSIYISAMIQRFGLTYPQARRAHMRTVGMTYEEIANKEGISISAVNDSIRLVNDKIKKGCDETLNNDNYLQREGWRI